MVILNAIFIILVFSSVIFLAYVTTKFIGKKTSKSIKGKYIKIIETVPLGFDKQLLLVKAGSTYVLVSAAGKSLQYLTTVSVENEEEIEEILNKDQVNFDFKSIFEKYSGFFDGKRKQNGTSNQANIKRTQTLSRIRAISERIHNTRDKHGDEETHEKNQDKME